MPRIVNWEEKREEVASAVWRVIMEDGLEQVTIRRIAKELGCSTGAIRHYFTNMQEVMIFALELAYDRLEDRVMEAIEAAQDGTALEKLRQGLFASLPSDDEKRAIWGIYRVALQHGALNTIAIMKQRKGAEMWKRVIEDLLVEGKKKGEFRKEIATSEEADTIIALIDGLGWNALWNVDLFPLAYAKALLNRHFDLRLLARVGDALEDAGHYGLRTDQAGEY